MSYKVDNLKDILIDLVQYNMIYELGHPHHPEIPHHPSHNPFLYSMSRMHGDLTYDNEVSSANDLITTGSHTGTHIDAIGHISCGGIMHNNMPVEGNQSKTAGLVEHGIDQQQPIIKRAVLLDVASCKGVPHLEAGYSITKKDLEETIETQNVKIQKGDAVFIRTGWSKHFDNPKKFISKGEGTPGINLEAGQFLVEHEISLAGGDTIAFEVTPTTSFSVHKLFLVDNGINIIEVLNLEDIAKDNIYSFIFVCLPLRIVGGTASPIRPIGIC